MSEATLETVQSEDGTWHAVIVHHEVVKPAEAVKEQEDTEAACSEGGEGDAEVEEDESEADEDAIHDAAARGNLHFVKRLVGSGVDVDKVATTGGTPLMKAACNGHIDIVKYLVNEQKASVNAADARGVNALMLASMSGAHWVLPFLAKDCGVDVNAKTRLGYTALMFAAQQGRLPAVRCLVGELGADVALRSSDGTTTMHIASHCGHTAIVDCLNELDQVSPQTLEVIAQKEAEAAAKQATLDSRKSVAGAKMPTTSPAKPKAKVKDDNDSETRSDAGSVSSSAVGQKAKAKGKAKGKSKK